jgi:formate dehydrogenase assembly factor FdhD
MREHEREIRSRGASRTPTASAGIRRASSAAAGLWKLAVEEPLEIRLGGRRFTLTMRTPGHDEELVAGFLLAEGFIESRDDLDEI